MVRLKQPLDRRTEITWIPVQNDTDELEQYLQTRTNNPTLIMMLAITDTGDHSPDSNSGHNVTIAINTTP
jgi:hypothetical protein